MKDREKHSLNRREFHFLRNVGQLPLAWARGHTFIHHNANCSSSALPDANENRGKSVTFGSRGRKREMGSSHLIFAKIVWIIRAHVQFFLTFALLRIYTWTGVCVCVRGRCCNSSLEFSRHFRWLVEEEAADKSWPGLFHG